MKSLRSKRASSCLAHKSPDHPPPPLSRYFFFFFFTLVTGSRRSLSLTLSDTRVYEPQLRARRGTTAGAGGAGPDQPAVAAPIQRRAAARRLPIRLTVLW